MLFATVLTHWHTVHALRAQVIAQQHISSAARMVMVWAAMVR
jgi:hypothetical protein